MKSKCKGCFLSDGAGDIELGITILWPSVSVYLQHQRQYYIIMWLYWKDEDRVCYISYLRDRAMTETATRR